MASLPPDVVVQVAGDADLGALTSLRATWSRVDEVDPEFEEQMAAWVAAEGDHRTTARAVSFYKSAGFIVPDAAAGNDRLLVRLSPETPHTGLTAPAAKS